MGFASKDPLPLRQIAFLDEESIGQIVAALPEGGYTHPASHPATMITEDTGHNFVTSAEKSNIHAPGSDNQDLSGKVDKVTGYSLMSDTHITDLTDGGETSLHTHPSSGGLSQSQILTRQL